MTAWWSGTFCPLCRALTAWAEIFCCVFTSDTICPSMDAKELLDGVADAVDSGSPNSSGISMRADGNGVASGGTMLNDAAPPAAGLIAEIGGVIRYWA
ncbi:MAG TPA: hypothetical protein VGJ73_21620 [Verrucomicrobiae bacterium]